MAGRLRSVTVAAVALAVLCTAGVAQAAVTPGWECIPTAKGQPVVSGGTASAPSCAAGSTGVLAPTYVASGVGAEPTVQFASVNVQILSGSGATSGAVNGKGNLVIGYDESPGTQTGSNNLVLGTHQSFTSYGAVLGGQNNQVTGAWSAAFGYGDTASSTYSLAAGLDEHRLGTSFDRDWRQGEYGQWGGRVGDRR